MREGGVLRSVLSDAPIIPAATHGAAEPLAFLNFRKAFFLKDLSLRLVPADRRVPLELVVRTDETREELLVRLREPLRERLLEPL